MSETITTQRLSDSDIETVTPTHQFHLHEQFNALPGKEVPSRRTAFTKTYDLGSGRFQAVLYPEPLHCLGGKGEWLDIDHTLKEADSVLLDDSPDLQVTFTPGGGVS